MRRLRGDDLTAQRAVDFRGRRIVEVVDEYGERRTMVAELYEMLRTRRIEWKWKTYLSLEDGEFEFEDLDMVVEARSYRRWVVQR